MRKVLRSIQPLDEDELEKDLRFLFHNRSETVDQFVDEAIPVFKYHANQVMASYQESLLENLTNSLKGDIAGIILRTRRETVYDEPKKQTEFPKSEQPKEFDGGLTDW